MPPVKSRFGVTREEVKRFVEGSDVVGSFLRKYRGEKRKGSTTTREVYGGTLCRFFKWLRLEKEWDVSPEELLNDQLRRRATGDVEERRKHVGLVLEFTRDNQDPYFQQLSDGRKYHSFLVIKAFYEYHEVQLTTAKAKYGNRRRRRHHPRQISVFDAKKILGHMKQRERTILLIMLQSGMEIGAVLYKFGYMWPEVKRQLDERRRRIKIEITERKGHDNWYFTYISRDAIHELKKWLLERAKIVEKVQKERGFVYPEIVEGTPIFITNDATPFGENNFLQNYAYVMKKRRKPYEKVSHMFRKLFKTEASVPERGIDRNIVEFWMGHGNGIEAVGGAYDRTPEIREEVIEKEYMKLEPYINIYSSAVRRSEDPLLKDVEKLSQLPGGRKFFAGIVKDAKEKLAEMLETQGIKLKED